MSVAVLNMFTNNISSQINLSVQVFNRVAIKKVFNPIFNIRIRKLSYKHNVGKDSLRPLTAGQLFDNTCRKHGNTEAIISCHQNSRFTFQQILDEADRLAAGFQAIGLKYGDRLGIWAPNLVEWYVANIACTRAGLIMVALNTANQAKEIEYCINKVRIKGIVCGHKFKTQNYYEMLRSIAPEIENANAGEIKSERIPSLESVIVITNESLKGAFKYDEVLDIPDKEAISKIAKEQNRIKMDDPCQIQFTSGTTGQPKASVISHFHVVNNGYYIGKRNELDKKQQKICVQVPLFHAFGTIITMSASINHGTTLVLPSPSFQPDKSLDAIIKEKCTIIHGTPTMYVDLVNRQKERKADIHAEIAVSGGAICAPSLFRDMLKELKLKKVKSVYGLSETTAVAFQSQLGDDETLSSTTVGHVSDHIEVKVIDIDGNLVPFGKPGELCTRGYINMLGYWEDEQKTREMIGSDGWLRTGDQFVLEQNGYGRVVGRLKEMIIRGGENIFPIEIEQFLNTHPDINEIFVIGLPHERLGEEVCACIRTRNNKTITLEEIKEFCKGNISHYKIPSAIEIMDSFPKTASGKIQKFKLLEIVQGKMKK